MPEIIERAFGPCVFPGCGAECATADFCRACGRHVCEKHRSNGRPAGKGHDPSDHWTMRALYCAALVESEALIAALARGTAGDARMATNAYRPCDEELRFVRFLPPDYRAVGCAELRCGQGHVLHVELPGEAAR